MSLHKNFIDGEWVPGTAERENVNPSDVSDIVGLYAQADRAQAEAAIAAAKRAQPGWARSTPQERCDALERVGSELLARKDEIGRLLAREEGKTLAEGIGEVARAAQSFKYFAQEAVRLEGDHFASLRPGIEITVSREPLGVIGVITPWNFPAAIPAWKIAPAIAFGNAVVFKPADLVPGTAWAIAEIISRSGLPKGVFNLVMGRGSSVGQALLEHKDVAAVTFTGSVETGRKVALACVERGAKFQLEMGGKNPLIVLDDADLDVAVAAAVNGAYFATGQRCTASSRLIVERGIHDAFVDKVTAAIKALKVDHALKEGTQMGPAVDAAQLEQDLRYIEIGRNEGAELVWGGERLNRETDGFYLSPALFANTRNDMRVNREEIFGPVASVIRVVDYEDALAVANDTPFGLSAGICTTSQKKAAHFRRHAEAGMVMVNLPTAGLDYHVPFGGRKGSSYGAREQGRYAVEFFTTVKTQYINPL